MVLSIGAGSLAASHVNDAGFWKVTFQASIVCGDGSVQWWKFFAVNCHGWHLLS